MRLSSFQRFLVVAIDFGAILTAFVLFVIGVGCGCGATALYVAWAILAAAIVVATSGLWLPAQANYLLGLAAVLIVAGVVAFSLIIDPLPRYSFIPEPLMPSRT